MYMTNVVPRNTGVPYRNELLDQLSPDLMKGLAEYAVREHRAGRCLTQEQVEDSIMEAMGWK